MLPRTRRPCDKKSQRKKENKTLVHAKAVSLSLAINATFMDEQNRGKVGNQKSWKNALYTELNKSDTSTSQYDDLKISGLNQ